MYYYLIHMKLEKLDVGAANPTLNRNHVHPIPARFPDLDAQVKIAQFLDQNTTFIDAMVANVQTSIMLLREYCAGLIAATVTGKISVCKEVP